eukprot:CAMPEP_0181348508 /NCGR_PEP_ID=MMETSP1106-20121128/214_1 /TAXON_ID=81844 /ORGANISM="Mantoniella antarctica, Strain SL-175" /LENGTH=68 /DNA_ID=CAMNT_0023460807 /DNA_START=229 /DNA_END=435 /DNA_ORIENTATION=+
MNKARSCTAISSHNRVSVTWRGVQPEEVTWQGVQPEEVTWRDDNEMWGVNDVLGSELDHRRRVKRVGP